MKKRDFNQIAAIAVIFAVLIIGCQIPGSIGGIRTLSGDITISPSSGVTTGTQLFAYYSGNEAVSYLWKKGETNVGTDSPIYTPTEAGSYTVTVSAADYKSKTSDAVIVIGASLVTTFVIASRSAFKILQVAVLFLLQKALDQAYPKCHYGLPSCPPRGRN